MWEISDYVVFIIGLLGFIFPKQLIMAIKIQDEKKSKEYQIKACLCFGCLMLLVALFLNSI